MAHHNAGKHETQTKLPFRLPSSTRAGYVMGQQGYSRKGKYPEDYDDEDLYTDDRDEDDSSERVDV